MRFVAIIAMIFGWLLFSASAWAGCPMCASTQQPAIQTHHDMAGMDMDAYGKRETAKDPCAPGDIVHMASCALCLVVPPVLLIDTGAKHAFAYPSPAIANALADTRSAPQAPPPRFV